MTSNPELPPTDPSSTERASVRDLRVPPRGVLPRHIQTWLMVGIALVIVLIILFTGQSQAPLRPASALRLLEPALAPADRIRSYEQQLAQEEARQRDAPARGADPRTSGTRLGGASPRTEASDVQQRRDEQSLFADNVSLSRRPREQQPFATPASTGRTTGPGSGPSATDDLALLDRALARMNSPRPSPTQTLTAAAAPVAPTETPRGATEVTVSEVRHAEYPAPGERLRLLEGTVIETALTNRLEGTFAGPVVCLVTTPVYSHDRQSILIPAGARVLGAASPVQSWGDSRLAVSFHRLVMPDGHTYSLNLFKGLNQIGEAGLRDRVNRHYLQVFGASLAIGALSGLAQYGTRSGLGTSDFTAEYRQAAGSSLASSASRVLERYLNVLPTITIREGYRVKVYLTNDFELPRYAAPASGGVR